MQEITFIGKTTFRNELKKFGIKKEDRKKHILIIGKTGMGKTELLLNMAFQDIKKGYGIGFFDPHGEAAERLLDFIPQKRINDVIYFNPADYDFPLAFNVFERIKPQRRYLVVSYLINVFKRIWSDVWSSSLEYILGNCILALLEYPTSTIIGIYRILTDDFYRKKVVEKITDPLVKSFWLQEFPEYFEREKDTISTIKNKMGQIVFNPVIRNIVCQIKSKIDFCDVLNKRKILIANLSRAKIGEENSELLGSFLFLRIHLATLRRSSLPPQKREDFYLYLDEFYHFVSKNFATFLADARRYNVSLTLSHQYFGQLEQITPFGKSEELKTALLGNVGTIISFRVGAEDASVLEKEFGFEFKASDFTNLPKYEMYVKLMVNGTATRGFSAISLPPIPTPKESFREKIIKVVRERYTTPREIVEKKMKKLVPL